MADGRLVDIEVAYGDDKGPDPHEVAKYTGLSTAEIVRRYTTPEYIVYFLDFRLGFAYMGELDKSLATPRRVKPYMAMPAGSTGIGGERTGIYPTTSPSGWRPFGRTNAVLFTSQHGPPTLLVPGDHIRFVAPKVRA